MRSSCRSATGDGEIVPVEAEVIRRIFRDYAAGLSPKALAKELNAECCPGPGGDPNTIHGNPARGTGILNNECTSAGSCGIVFDT